MRRPTLDMPTFHRDPGGFSLASFQFWNIEYRIMKRIMSYNEDAPARNGSRNLNTDNVNKTQTIASAEARARYQD